MAWMVGTIVIVAVGYTGIRLIATKWGSQPPLFPRSGSTWTDNTYKIRLVYVPAGEFLMGSSEQVTAAFNDCVTFHKECLREFFEDQAPQHRVSVASFWIMQTEVTNLHYQQCVDAGKCTKPNNTSWDKVTNSQYPVTDVDWHQANAYAAWVGGRLPTEAEWEKAARGPNGFIYPWGDAWDASRVNYCDKNCSTDWRDQEHDDGYAQTAPVGDYPQGASPYGALDMAGNVWEWTGSLYKGYPYAPDDGREDLAGTGDRVLRGGAWFDSRDAVRTAFRRGRGVDFRDFGLGFRVVRVASLP
jgi:formylglycine-generating enzyme required for sulfatase activity